MREASRRKLGLRHFDVQLIGGLALHSGKIAEMRTGEGKTLMATLPAYLNALSGDGVHVVTVNEYLAQRDSDWMAPVYRFLGFEVGVIKNAQTQEEKRAAYACDITYGTNNEFGFDYLRDNLAFRLEDRAQRKLSFAIIDEVDSILIDEARTPLIISGPAEESTELYIKINTLIPRLVRQKEENGPGDYAVDEKTKQTTLTEDGHEKVEELMAEIGLLRDGESLYDATNIKLMHHLNAALRAHALYKRDVEYIVRQGEVIIVDEFTGRTMPGRRWSDGLHQAVEAKEGVKVREENQTVASITFQNFFRLYSKLSGMTGTADTEAFEFQQIYGLEVVVIPTHKPMIRKDNADLVFLSENDKFQAILEDIQDCVKRGQPALVGTTSIETSERLAKLLTAAKIPHAVLNAKQHEREAHIVAEAGRPGAVTIATNMAGRGTDIVLGGSPQAQIEVAATDEAEVKRIREEWRKRHDEVVAAGGLHIIGTERHESRRIDNQLRGRSGRQGDPGSSRFYLSLEDNLMRIFGDPTRMKALMTRVGMKQGEAIESGMLTRQIERAQRRVEQHNFDARKAIARIRRRGERSAPRDLSAAHRPHERRGRGGSGQGHPRGGGRATRRPISAGRRRRGALGRPRPGAGHRAGFRPGTARRRVGEGGGGGRRLRAEAQDRRRSRTGVCAEGDQRSGRRSCATSKKRSCCGPSTSIGASIWPRWITCGRAFSCAVTRRRIPSRNTSARPSSCSRRCWTASSSTR